MVNNEKKEIRKLVDKIVSFAPDIIFVEKQANRLATEMLQQSNITITQNVKPSILAKITKITRAKQCPMNKLEKYETAEKIIGKCKGLQFR